VSDQLVQNLAIGIAVVALLLYRQLSTRAVRTERGSRFVLIIGAFGLLQAYGFVHDHGHLGVVAIAASVVSLALAAAFSAARAYSVRLWATPEGWLRRGTVVTLLLWLASIGSHVGIDALAAHVAPAGEDIQGFGNATLLVYLALSLGLQQVLVVRRIRALSDGPDGAGGGGTGPDAPRRSASVAR
jgi:hypothetical protein